jgi:hypothetical protein
LLCKKIQNTKKTTLVFELYHLDRIRGYNFLRLMSKSILNLIS